MNHPLTADAGPGSRNMVGPVIKSGELADAVAEAVWDDNPQRRIAVEDHSGYIRIKVEQECVLRRRTIEEYLGRPFELAELRAALAAFAGQVEFGDETLRFYYDKTL